MRSEQGLSSEEGGLQHVSRLYDEHVLQPAQVLKLQSLIRLKGGGRISFYHHMVHFKDISCFKVEALTKVPDLKKNKNSTLTLKVQPAGNPQI